MGLGSILTSVVPMTVIEHLPSPWGLGTLPGGMESIPPEGMSFEGGQVLLGHVIGLILGIGVAGSTALVAGGVTAFICKLKNNSSWN
jgi:hypothetical protein